MCPFVTAVGGTIRLFGWGPVGQIPGQWYGKITRVCRPGDTGRYAGLQLSIPSHTHLGSGCLVTKSVDRVLSYSTHGGLWQPAARGGSVSARGGPFLGGGRYRASAPFCNASRVVSDLCLCLRSLSQRSATVFFMSTVVSDPLSQSFLSQHLVSALGLSTWSQHLSQHCMMTRLIDDSESDSDSMMCPGWRLNSDCARIPPQAPRW